RLSRRVRGPGAEHSDAREGGYCKSCLYGGAILSLPRAGRVSVAVLLEQGHDVSADGALARVAQTQAITQIAQLQYIRVAHQVLAHLLAVHEAAVGAPGILDDDAVRPDEQPRVMAADHLRMQRDVVLGSATD